MNIYSLVPIEGLMMFFAGHHHPQRRLSVSRHPEELDNVTWQFRYGLMQCLSCFTSKGGKITARLDGVINAEGRPIFL